MKRIYYKGFQPFSKQVLYIGKTYSDQTLREARLSKKENKAVFNIDSAYEITEIVFGKIIPGNNTDYGIFVLRGTPKYGHGTVLILALMSTDGKAFWPIASNVKDEKAFTADPLLSTGDGNLSAVLQRTKDGNLVVSFFSTEANGTCIETSRSITLPAETTIR